MCNLEFQKLFLKNLGKVECSFRTRVTDNFKFYVEKIVMDNGFDDNTLYDGIERNKFDFTKLQVVEKIHKYLTESGCELDVFEVAEWFKMAYDATLAEFR